MQQQNICIGEVDVPIILNGGEEWFPISYLSNKVLLRNNTLITKRNRDKYIDHLHKFRIKFNENNIQESNCIDKIGLIEVLSLSQAARLTVEQRKSQNELHKYLDIILLPEEEIDSRKYKKEWFNEIDTYTKDVIKNELDNETVEWIRLCTKCNCHYPLTNRFYNIDKRADKGFNKTCMVCIGHGDIFTHQDKDKQKMRKQSKELFDAFNSNSIFSVYEAYRKGKLNRLPDCYENEESYEKIIRELFDRGELTVNNLTSEYITKNCRLSGMYRHMDMVDIYKLLFGENFYLYAWKYPKFSFRSIKLTSEIGKQIINNYIKENNVLIYDIFKFDYEKLFKECSLSNLTNGNTLGFIVQYYNQKYAGYLFKTQTVNYYKNDENLLFDLKYLIEQDMKLNIDKIPLYLTKNVLHKKCSALYHYIITNNNGTIFEWVNKLYPNKFCEADFEINPYRNEFDSDTEAFIHEILKKQFGGNVIYNQRNNNDTIKLKGKIPDWLLFTDKGVWVIEYFGMLNDHYVENSRIKEYKNKTIDKLNIYKQLSGYNFLYLYPSDIDDDFKGCREKIEKIEQTLGT